MKYSLDHSIEIVIEELRDIAGTDENIDRYQRMKYTKATNILTLFRFGDAYSIKKLLDTYPDLSKIRYQNRHLGPKGALIVEKVIHNLTDYIFPERDPRTGYYKYSRGNES